MKILYLTHYERLYGANRALLALVCRLKEEGTHTPIVVVPMKGELTEALEGAGVRYEICPVTQWQAIYVEAISFARKKAKRRAAIAEELEDLSRRFSSEGIDLIHSNSSVIGTGAMLAKRLGCRHVWHVREYAREHYGMEYFYPEEEVRSLYEEADAVVAISDALKDHLRKLYPAARVVRIYDGIDTDAAAFARKERSWDYGSAAPGEKDLRFLYTGYLFPAKRQLDVIRAAKLLVGEGIRDIHISFAGDGDRSYLRRLARAASAKALKGRIFFAGYVRDISGLLENSDVGIIASDHEGFGLATAEYMRAGLPVIGRRSGATPELVEEGVTGLLYDDVNGLAGAMKSILLDREKAERMGKAGEERVRTHFGIGQNVDAIMALYRTLEKGTV